MTVTTVQYCDLGVCITFLWLYHLSVIDHIINYVSLCPWIHHHVFSATSPLDNHPVTSQIPLQRENHALSSALADQRSISFLFFSPMFQNFLYCLMSTKSHKGLSLNLLKFNSLKHILSSRADAIIPASISGPIPSLSVSPLVKNWQSCIRLNTNLSFLNHTSIVSNTCFVHIHDLQHSQSMLDFKTTSTSRDSKCALTWMGICWCLWRPPAIQVSLMYN